MSASLPHFPFPFQLDPASGVPVVDQGSYADTLTQVGVVVACPVGACPELPTFGRPDPTFLASPVDPGALVAAVQQWVPDADTTAVVTALDEFGASQQVALAAGISGTGQ